MSEPTVASLIAELGKQVPEVEKYHDVAGILHADLIASQLKRYADAAILALLKALRQKERMLRLAARDIYWREQRMAGSRSVASILADLAARVEEEKP